MNIVINRCKIKTRKSDISEMDSIEQWSQDTRTSQVLTSVSEMVIISRRRISYILV